MKVKLISILFMVTFSGCLSFGCSDSADMQQLNQTLRVLNKNGVVYSGSIEGPTEVKGGFRTEFYGGTGGWVRLNLTGPQTNPMAGKTEPETIFHE